MVLPSRHLEADSEDSRTFLREYIRSSKRYIDDRNDGEEHEWIGLGYYLRTYGETSNYGSTTALGMTKLSWL